MRLKLEWTIWQWQFGCNDAWTPEFTDNFGWSLKIKSIQKELLVCKCVGSFINWETPFGDVNERNFSLSESLMSSDHQHDVLPLKSPVITNKNGLVFSYVAQKSLSTSQKWIKFTVILVKGTVYYGHYHPFIIIIHF